MRQQQSLRLTLISAWIFSASWLMGSVWWLHIALHVHGHLPAFLSLAAIHFVVWQLGFVLHLSHWHLLEIPINIESMATSHVACSCLDHGRNGQGPVVHGISMGGNWLCANQQWTVIGGALAGRLWCWIRRCLCRRMACKL